MYYFPFTVNQIKNKFHKYLQLKERKERIQYQIGFNSNPIPRVSSPWRQDPGYEVGLRDVHTLYIYIYIERVEKVEKVECCVRKQGFEYRRSVLRRQSRDTNRNIKRSVYCQYE